MPRRFRPLALAVALVLGLSSCAQTGIDESAPPTAPSPTPPAGPATQEPVTDEAVTQEATATSSAAPADPEDCLQGVWLADNAYFLASMNELGDGVDSVDGQVTLTFGPDRTVTTEYTDWQVSGFGEGGAVVISRSGVDAGVYSVGDGRLSLEETDVGSSMTVSVGGMEMAVPPTPTVFTDVAFTCATTSASIDAPEGTLKLTRA